MSDFKDRIKGVEKKMGEKTYQMTELGYALKEYRVRNNMTQTELAKDIGVSANTIHLWETKCCRPAMSSLVILSEILGEPLVEIIVMARQRYR